MDTLRPPGPLDTRPEAYRDWLHFNLFDPASQVVGLVNASLHGAPNDPRARAIGTALLHHPAHGWIGNMEVREFGFARLSETSIGLESVALAVDPAADRLCVSVQMPDERVSLTCTALRASTPVHIEQQLPFGSGWISWSLLPRLRVEGDLAIGERRIDLAAATGYHDHNWGRWFWGDDAGWDWGTFTDCDEATTVVFSRAADRDRRHTSPSLVTVERRGKRRSFMGPSVRFTWEGAFREPLRRLPGSLAALHADRAEPRLPSSVRLEAMDGQSNLWLDFSVRAAAQLIAAEPTRPGTSFVHELIGSFRGEYFGDGSTRPIAGVGVVEYVD